MNVLLPSVSVSVGQVACRTRLSLSLALCTGRDVLIAVGLIRVLARRRRSESEMEDGVSGRRRRRCERA